jgi:hypothetical protein
LRRLSKESVQVRGLFLNICKKLIFYSKGLLAPRPTSKLEGHPLSFVRGYLFRILAATLHSWRPFLYPQLKDEPCCGDKGPPNTECRGQQGKQISSYLGRPIILLTFLFFFFRFPNLFAICINTYKYNQQIMC